MLFMIGLYFPISAWFAPFDFREKTSSQVAWSPDANRTARKKQKVAVP